MKYIGPDAEVSMCFEYIVGTWATTATTSTGYAQSIIHTYERKSYDVMRNSRPAWMEHKAVAAQKEDLLNSP